MESLALDILKFPKEANINFEKPSGDNAFVVAYKNKMFGVASIINSMEENGSSYEIDKINQKQQHWDKLHSSIKTSTKTGCCVYCMEDDSKFHIILPCAHAVGVCTDCDPEFKKCRKCMVCMKPVKTVQPIYVVQ